MAPFQLEAQNMLHPGPINQPSSYSLPKTSLEPYRRESLSCSTYRTIDVRSLSFCISRNQSALDLHFWDHRGYYLV